MKKYKLRYLPLFEQDLNEAVMYIADVLNNPQAAEKLINEVEKAILERQKMPLSFEPYHSAKKRENDYYRIYVGNYTVFLCRNRRCNGSAQIYLQRSRPRQTALIICKGG